MSEFTAQALEYYDRGWCVLPMKAKRPACRWREYQRTRPDVGTVRRWFRQRDLDGLGVLAGAVSGGLVCRDYDQLESYERWAHEHPELAGTLPTALTARGRHVWFRADVVRVIDLGDGELRGKDFTVLPPSRHPSGHVYAWAVPLPAGPLPFVDPFKAGLAPSVTERTERIERIEAINLGEPFGKYSVDEVVELTQPSGIGERNGKLWILARALKAVPGMASADLAALRRILRRWHEQALPRIGTKPFDDTWFEFLRAWRNAKFPLGAGPMTEIMQMALSAPLPPEALDYDTDEVRWLVVLCRELQRAAGEGPFFLSCRTAAVLLKVDQMTAWRWLCGLVYAGLLQVVEKGRQAKSARRATRFRYLGKL